MFDERVDATIDEVAREMTKGELPPDFRARVIARLDSGDDRRWTWRPAWVLAPLAVAAAVLLAVLVVRAPWGPRGPAQDVRSEVRLKPDPTYLGRDPDPTSAGKPPSYVGTDSGRIASAERAAGVPSNMRSRTAEQGILSDLAPAPIQIESLDVEAMESMDITPPSVDAMEWIDVPRLDVAPLEVAAIAE